MGRIKVKFAEENAWGILDHDVTTAEGTIFHNPLRLIRNGQGTELVFTLFRTHESSEEGFEKDAGQVAKDLAKLKTLLEDSAP